MGSSHIAGLKIACWGEAQKPHSAEAVCQRELADMTGAAVGAVPAEASCPRVAGVLGAGSPAKKRVFFRMTKLSGVAPRPKGLGAKAFTL